MGRKSSNSIVVQNRVSKIRLPVNDGYVETRKAPKRRSWLGSHWSATPSPGRKNAHTNETAAHKIDLVRAKVVEKRSAGNNAATEAPTSITD